jgi:hypothetical protein
MIFYEAQKGFWALPIDIDIGQISNTLYKLSDLVVAILRRVSWIRNELTKLVHGQIPYAQQR